MQPVQMTALQKGVEEDCAYLWPQFNALTGMKGNSGSLLMKDGHHSFKTTLCILIYSFDIL